MSKQSANRIDRLVIEEQTWRTLREIGIRCVFPPGTRVRHQGEASRWILLLDDGAMKIVRTETNGREAILGWRFAPSLIGLDCAFDQTIISQSAAETCGPSTVYQIAADQFSRFICEHEDASLVVHRCQASEVREHEIRAGVFAACSARERLEWVLTRLALARSAPVEQQPIRIALPLRGVDLAQAIGVTSESISRLLARLERDRVIRRHRGWFVLPQPHLLVKKWADSIARD